MFEKLVLAFYYAWYGTPWGTGVLHEWFGWAGSGYDPEKTVMGGGLLEYLSTLSTGFTILAANIL